MYWFFYGVVVGAGAMRLLTWNLDGQIVIPWYAWLLGIITVSLATLTLQTFFASFQEREPKAAWMSLLVMGVPTLILAAISTVVVLRL
jgi:hypothetical protein